MTMEDRFATSNAALVESLFEAFAARDEHSLLALVHPEIEFFGPTATALNEGKCYRGHDGIRRYFQDASRLWDRLELLPLTFREVGHHVVVLGRVRARAWDDMELDTPAAWVWRVQDGLVVWGCAYGDPESMPRSLQEEGRDRSTGAVSAALDASRQSGGRPLPAP
jgi:ketosteroid isomerase-like protein